MSEKGIPFLMCDSNVKADDTVSRRVKTKDFR